MKSKIIAAISGIVLPFISFAQPYAPNVYGPQGGFYDYLLNRGGFGGGYRQPAVVNFGGFDGLINMASRLIGYGQIIVFLIAIGFFLFAAYQFVVGNAAGGRLTLLYAVIGVVVGLLAFTLIPMICSLLGASQSAACSVGLI